MKKTAIRTLFAACMYFSVFTIFINQVVSSSEIDIIVQENEYISKSVVASVNVIEEQIVKQVKESIVKEEKKKQSKNIEDNVTKPKSLGTYKLTAYCACSACCGSSTGITASGTVATQGRTVACNSLPIGTIIVINGHEYIIEDRGGMASNVIDVFFNSHQEALNFGVQYAEVYVVN